MPSRPRAVTVRGKRRWRIDICVNGKRESRTRDTKNEALTWAVEREAVLRRTKSLIHGKTVHDAIMRHKSEMSKERKGYYGDQLMLIRFSKDEIAQVPLTMLGLDDAHDFIARSLDSGVANDTVLRRLALLRTTIRMCVKWRWIESYPWDGMETPKTAKPRTRLPTQAEIDLIIKQSNMLNMDKYCAQGQQEAAIAFLFSIETAMRLGEICGLKPEDIDLKTRVAFLADTKNGDSRHVPLSSRAIELLAMLPARKSTVFGVSANNCSSLFRYVLKKAGIKGLRFHDARAEATVRLSKKLDIFQLARVTGHRDYNTLQTYYRETAADIAKMLD